MFILGRSYEIPREKRLDHSKENWQKYWRGRPLNAFNNRNGKDVPYDVLDNWVNGREIRVFLMPDVDNRTVEPVIHGINELIREIRLLDFLIDIRRHYYGPHESAVQVVKRATQEDGRLNGSELASLLVAESWRDPARGGRPHADVVITGQHLAMGDENWGQSQFEQGYILISVPGQRQESLEFIRNVAKHEAGHLFGYLQHHDSIGDVPGYDNTTECNMLWRSSTAQTCEKCKDALVHIWKGIEERSGKKFLR